jgi:uncharacterized protein (DUF1501 family)
MNDFYSAAKGLMYNPTVSKAFGFTAQDSLRYGNTGFGNACLVAKQVLAANEGTRFIQITLGGWDMHQSIYGLNGDPTKGTNIFTVGKLSAAAGRDHYQQQFCLFAGAGVKGGRAIGSTTADGSATVDPGWSRARDIVPEDIEATIYSAMGINWTTIRYDDPFGRGFEYVPFAKDDVYGPINELWAS